MSLTVLVSISRISICFEFLHEAVSNSFEPVGRVSFSSFFRSIFFFFAGSGIQFFRAGRSLKYLPNFELIRVFVRSGIQFFIFLSWLERFPKVFFELYRGGDGVI